MILKRKTFALFFISSLFIYPSCGETNINPVIPDNVEGSDNNNDKEQETIADGNEIIIDMNSNAGPDIAYWRGAQGPGMNGFLDNENKENV